MSLFILRALTLLAFYLSFYGNVSANLIVNGSFENGSFSNQGSNYMKLLPGDTNLNGWTIINEVAWGLSPTDGFTASDGSGLIDLSSFGAQSPNGSVSQSFATIIGEDYQFSFDVRGLLSIVEINGAALALSSGASSGGNWTNYNSTFTATSILSNLTITNNNSNNTVVMIDDIVVNGPSAVPEPSILVLFGAGLFVLGVTNIRRKVQT